MPSLFKPSSTSASARGSRIGACPTADITTSASSEKVEPSIGIGLRRPVSSGSPSFIRTHSIPLTFPFSPIIFFGAVR